MELEVTWKRAMRVWWSWLWRSLIAVLISSIICGFVGFIIGFIVGAISGAMRLDQDIMKPIVMLVIGTISFIIGLGISVVPVKMILGKNFGEFRLILVSTHDSKIQN